MDKRFIAIAAFVLFCFGCAGGVSQGLNAYEVNKAVMPSNAAGQSGLVFDPLNIDGSALPDIHDLPAPPIQTAKKYTGIIKNNTRFDVSIPARNSSATITIPAYGWVEYTAWNSYFNVTVYHDGKPFYCINIHAHLQNYPFMCKKYDFIAEIVKEEPVIRERPVQKKRPLKRKPKCDQGVEALG
jgi:hypothetical protein